MSTALSTRIEKKVTEDFLMGCQVTYTGNKYVPVTHSDVIITIDEYLRECNLNIRTSKYLAGSNGQRAVGILGVESSDLDLDFMLAWKNSLDGSMSFKLAYGAQVRICSNGMFQGDTGNYKKKHMGDAQDEIKTHIIAAVNCMAPTMAAQIDMRDLYKEIQVTRQKAAELIGRLYLIEEGITATQLSVVKKEIEKPSCNYGAPGSAWELYNHCTYALRDTHPLEWHRQHETVGDFFNKEFGIAA